MQSIAMQQSTDGIAPASGDLAGWVVTDGAPSMKTWVRHSALGGAVVSGIWECRKGRDHATATADESGDLIKGRIVITPDGGMQVTVQAGDAFGVGKDFKGTRKIEEDVLKHFDLVVN